MKQTSFNKTVKFYEKQLLNPSVDIKIPDEVISSQFRELANFLNSYSPRLFEEQAKIFREFTETGNYEDFLRKFNLLKNLLKKKVDSEYDAIL